MLRNATQLEGFGIRATDGELGTVYQLYFDDETWVIRYLCFWTSAASCSPTGGIIMPADGRRRTSSWSGPRWRSGIA
jgi:hypothetical protein